MSNTENTILENWPGQKIANLPRRPTYHFALRQDNVNLDFHLEQFYRSEKISLHYFDRFEQLVTICRRFPVDAIVIGGKSDFLREIELVRAIKQNIFLSIVPIILYHPSPEVSTLVAAYENGAEDFLHGEWKDKLVKVRIQRVIERSQRDLAVNPSTRLPGPTIIEREITRQLDMKAEFAICYADLDNFKAYNDYYGYVEGDGVIRLTATVIKDIVFDLCREGFVGHIAGDDFIMVIPAELVEPVCRWTIRTFDALVPYRYEPADRERGYITTLSRRGEVENFPILTISIAVTINTDGKFCHVGEMSRMLADLKGAIKRRQGSNYMVERRRKY